MPSGLFIEGEIRDREAQKDAVPGTPVSAFELFVSGFVRSVLRFSRREKIYFSEEALGMAAGPTAPEWLHSYRGRISSVPANEFESLGNNENLCLVSMGPELLNFAWLRSQIDRSDWPIFGMLHGLAPTARLRYLLTNRLVEFLNAWDALVCPSVAAQKAMCLLSQAVPESVRTYSRLPFQLPVVPQGIDTQHFGEIDKATARTSLGFASDEVLVLCIGRIAPLDTYDPIPLFLSFGKIHTECKIRLIIAGDDTQARMAERLRAAAPQLGCGERVVVLPNITRQEKRALLCAADIFVSPDDNSQDSFALGILEAMASGLPIVTSDWMSSRELVDHGRNGFLVPTIMSPGRGVDLIGIYSGIGPEKLIAMSTSVDIDAMTEALSKLIEHDNLRREMGTEGRRLARSRYDWREIIRLYDDLWDASCESGTGSRSKLALSPIPMQSVLKSFGTQTLNESHWLARTQTSDNNLQATRILAATRHFRNDVFEALFEALDAHGQAPVGSIVDAVRARLSASPVTVERHIGRLVKYGLLSVT